MKDETESLTTSLEATDALIDESWDWTTLNRIDPGLRNNTTAEFRINIGDSVQDDGSFVGNVWKYWKERDINLKLRKYCEKETDNFHKQFSAKILGIYADEETKSSLVKEMIPRMSACLLQNTPHNGNAEHRFRLTREIVPRISTLVNEVKASLDEMKALDPLHNWYKQKSDISSRMMMRVQNLASSISNKVQWIFLVQPGYSHSSLESFAVEYDILERFFDKAKLSSEELSQRAFDQNIPKVRNRKIECVDYTRVKLRSQINHVLYGSGEPGLLIQKPQRITSFSKSSSKLPNNQIQSDFIHANYVSGGPLLNTFILTQAPLLNTMQDFWRMIWQEKSEYIFMLCGASGDKSFALTDPTAMSHCPVYWPRYQGDVMRFGKLTIRNDKVDATADPLFNVTHLTLSMDDNKRAEVKVQHWQWDWREFTDFDWPFRVLLRSRHSKTPTVIHCLDGCGKSGTLILIEIFLMQLLRGTTSCDNPMITSAIFLRLQRRHAVANQMQYLYAYRTVLDWIEPFTISTYHRFVIGWLFKNSGFIGKYDQLAKSMTKSLL
ncbi:protein-tyrosine phosphatase domain-containing protein [Ditylenchus destructor]|uniref:Protein-tyrosine phosphatase domain-containing protein n=1 Tax=Ditylenchus destructor TaxID=166010 RepID=A0AAD4MVE6_9BILA|nr:protein-tyrosine phosphatase domain-containing protein [Ditylenchus destructor]